MMLMNSEMKRINQIASRPGKKAANILQWKFAFTAFGRLELEWCERKILLGWLELELVAGMV